MIPRRFTSWVALSDTMWWEQLFWGPWFNMAGEGEEREGSSQIRGMRTVFVRVWAGHVENMGWNPGHLLRSRGLDLVLGRAKAWGELLRLIVGVPEEEFPQVLLPGLPLRSAMRVCLPPSPFLHSFLPFFLLFFFHFFLPFFFSFLFPPERADFYQANSIKKTKNCFWISEPDQIPDSLLNSCMNLGKWFTPAPPFFSPHRGKNSSTTLNLGGCKHSFKECL